MREHDRRPPGEAGRPGRTEGTLIALGALTVAIPYLARPLGLGVDVASRIEIADHVIPGSLVAVLAIWLAARHHRRHEVAGLVGAGACFLAGFWVLATHVPLLAEAARGHESWGAAAWHSSTAPVIIVLSLLSIFRSDPAD